jgi:hypothetical protein
MAKKRVAQAEGAELIEALPAGEVKEVVWTVVDAVGAALEMDYTAVPEGWLSLLDMSKTTELTAQYLRTRVLKGTVAAVKMSNGSISKWFLDPKTIKRGVRSGLRRYLLRTDSSNEDKIREALDDLDIEYTLELAYTPKDEAEAAEAAESGIESGAENTADIQL